MTTVSSRAAGSRRCTAADDRPRLGHAQPAPGREQRRRFFDDRRQPQPDALRQIDALHAPRPPAFQRVPVLARDEEGRVGDHPGDEVAQVQAGGEAQVQTDHQDDRHPAAVAHRERREQQHRQHRLGGERAVGEPAREAGRHPVAKPDREPGRQPIQVDRVVNGAAVAPARALLVDRVEEVTDRELPDHRQHRQRNPLLRGGGRGRRRGARGLLRRRAPPRQHRVDREVAAGREERRPPDQQTEHHVAAVVEQQRAAVQAQHADQRRDLRQLRPEADQQRQEGEQADDETDHRLVRVRRQVKQREHVVPRRAPQHRVVRDDAVVRVPEPELGPAPEQIPEQDQRQHDAPGRQAAQVGGEIDVPDAVVEPVHARKAAAVHRARLCIGRTSVAR